MLRGKTILLTGGTSGIGIEMVKLLAADNRLLIAGRDVGKLKKLKSQFPDITTYRGDLSKAGAGIKLGGQIADKEKSLDMVIHNAAVQNEPRLTDKDFKPENIAGEVNTNLTSIVELTQALLPSLEKSNAAVICNINSGLALAPKTNSAVYCATKAALNIFSLSLSYQLAGSRIRVAQAFLPLVDTPMTQGRGTGKISAAKAAQDIVSGLAAGKTTINVGKVKLLRVLLIVAPWLARRILKAS